MKIKDSINAQYYIDILKNPDSKKVYFDEDGSMLVWHSTEGAQEFAKSYMMGGFVPGQEAGSLYGDGLYTNITPCQTARRKYGQYVHVFKVSMDEKVLKHTCIGDPEVYRQMHNGQCPDDWFISQFYPLKRITADQAVVKFLTNYQTRATKNCTHDLFEGWPSSEWFQKFWRTLQNVGFWNIVYWGHNDKMCWVSWKPYECAQHVAVFSCPKNTRDWRLLSDSSTQVEQSQASNEFGTLMSTVLSYTHGSFKQRLDKMIDSIDVQKCQQLAEYINQHFPDDKYTSNWKPEMIKALQAKKPLPQAPIQ